MAVRQVPQQGVAAAAFHDGGDGGLGAGTDDQVAFEVARHGPVGGLGRALADRDPAAARGRRCGWAAGFAQLPTGPQARGELTVQPATRLNVDRLVDRLVRHPHLRLIGKVQPQPASDLLGAVLGGQPRLHLFLQLRIGGQLARLGTGPGGLGGGMGHARGVVQPGRGRTGPERLAAHRLRRRAARVNPVQSQLAGDGGNRPAQCLGERGIGLAPGQALKDAFPLFQPQIP